MKPATISAARAGPSRARVPSGYPRAAARAAGGITLGVEEEFLLLNPATGATVLAAPDLLRLLDGVPGVAHELMRFQVEIATPVCAGLDEVGRELVRLRRLVAAGAARLGCRLVASGIAPYATPGLAALTGNPRYWELARRYGQVVADSGTCACHVHVGIPSRDLGVQVLARLRPWLPSLLALTVNSPIAGGRDTGWASWRYVAQSRWPTATPPAVWPDAASYDATVHRLIRGGAALDERSVYFLARLSPRYPTVEVRVADICLDVGTAVLVAGLTRALVATALAEGRRGCRSQRRRPLILRQPLRPPRGTGSPGQESTHSPGGRPVREPFFPACWNTSGPYSATMVTPEASSGCCNASISAPPGQTASASCSPAPCPFPHTWRRSRATLSGTSLAVPPLPHSGCRLAQSAVPAG